MIMFHELYGTLRDMEKPAQARGSALAGDRGFLAPWLGVGAVLCVPIWLPSLPPLSDLYNHLARIHILAHRDEIAAYAAYYGEDWGLMPNLALDLAGIPLLAVFDLATVAKLFLTLTVLLWHAGCTYLGRVLCGRVPRRALVCAFFVYNQQFLHGYVNFSFGMGLALVALALWLSWRERLATWRIAPLTALGTAVFLAHLSAFATLALAVTAMTAVRLVEQRRVTPDMLLAAVPLLPGVAAFFYGFLSRTGEGNPIAYPPLVYNLRDSVTVLVGYSPILDAISLVAVAALVAVALWLRTGLRVRREVLAAAVTLAVAYWVCPSDVASGIEVNVRFALGAVTLLALAVDVALPARAGNSLLAVALGLFTARTAVTAAHWIDLDREFQGHLEAFAAIEEGAALHNIYFYPTGRLFNATRVRGLALIHTPAFAAVTRHALVPTLYGMPGQQPLVHRVPMYRSHRFHDRQRPTIAWDRIFGHYHYVWTCRAPADLIAPLVERGRLRARAGECALYQLDAPGALPAPATGAGGR
jgi:hypothetical protein